MRISAAGALESALSQVQTLIHASGADVAVACRTLSGRDHLLIDSNQRFHAASTMKIPVMIELFRQDRAGSLNLDDEIATTNRFKSVVDGSAYQLALEDEGERDVHESSQMTLRDLCERMITVSSNLATNLLIEHLGLKNIQSTLDEMGIDGMQVQRGVEDLKAFEQGMNNTTTAGALLLMLEAVARHGVVDAAACDEMLGMLRRQRFNEGIPAGLPPGVPVAHKTGNITAIHHDAGIIYPAAPYVLVVLVQGIESIDESAALIAAVARTTYETVMLFHAPS